MTRFGWIVAFCFAAGVAILGTAAYFWHGRSAPVAAPEAQDERAVSTTDPSELAIYTSGEYGFSFFYPAQARVLDAFSSSTEPAPPWRVQAIATGTSIVRIVAGVDEARVGVSSNPKELAACEKAGPAETRQSVITVASTSWQRFVFEKVGTDDERRVTSYRAVHAARCYAIEVLTPLNEVLPTASSTDYTIRDLISSVTFAH